jgi:hypothetical protein
MNAALVAVALGPLPPLFVPPPLFNVPLDAPPLPPEPELPALQATHRSPTAAPKTRSFMLELFSSEWVG